MSSRVCCITPQAIRRFALPDEENPKGFTGKAKCGGRKRTKGASPTALPVARAREAGEAHSGCYVQLPPRHIVKYAHRKLQKATMLTREKENGDRSTFRGAVRGNKTYAFRQEKKIDTFYEEVKFEPERTTFHTLTTENDFTEEGRKQTWKDAKTEMPKYIRELRKLGMENFHYTYEATELGGCHAHMVVLWKKPVQGKLISGELRVADDNFWEKLKGAWKWQSDIKRARDENAAGYIRKYIGKNGQVEDAVKRANRQWRKEGDRKHQKEDVKKLWGYFYLCNLNMRQYNTGRKKPEEGSMGKRAKLRKEQAQAAAADVMKEQSSALINQMTNSTEEGKPKWKRVTRIPKWVSQHCDCEPYNGKIEKDSRMGKLFDMYFSFLDDKITKIELLEYMITAEKEHKLNEWGYEIFHMEGELRYLEKMLETEIEKEKDRQHFARLKKSNREQEESEGGKNHGQKE